VHEVKKVEGKELWWQGKAQAIGGGDGRGSKLGASGGRCMM